MVSLVELIKRNTQALLKKNQLVIYLRLLILSHHTLLHYKKEEIRNLEKREKS